MLFAVCTSRLATRTKCLILRLFNLILGLILAVVSFLSVVLF